MKSFRKKAIVWLTAATFSLSAAAFGACAANSAGTVAEKGEKGDTGATGANGVDGATWLSGNGAPTAEQGKDGDFYFAESTCEVYKKLSGAWKLQTTLKGEKGEQGATGAQGEKGDKGDKGETGAQGATGAQGEKGDKGDKGETGAQGAQGEKGDKGEDGVDGTNGKDGATWLSGIGAPTAEQGKDGDFYFAESTCGIYKKSNGAWTLQTTLKGEKGDKGETGAQGVGIEKVTVAYDGKVTILLTDGTEHTITVEKACDHTNMKESVTKPTCQERGYTMYTCEDCGYKYVNDYTPATGHHFYDRYCVYCAEEEPFGVIDTDTSWYNSSTSTFTLTTREQFAGFAYLVNTGTNFSKKTVKLGANIDLGYEEWIPIGTTSAPFEGTFNGQNLTISNLKITQSDLTENIGLFGCVTGTLQDFKVENADVSSAVIGSNIGIACGKTTGKIWGVCVSGNLTAKNFTYVGGVAGYVYAGFGNATLSGMENAAAVEGKEYVGGVAGYWYATDNFTAYAWKNTGAVKASDLYAGGIFGHVSAKKSSVVKECASGAAVEGKAYVGGIAGQATAVKLLNCVNDGTSVKAAYTVSDSGDRLAYLGGFVGDGATASGCTNAAAIDYEYEAWYVGGVAGTLSGSTENCANSGKINAPKATYVGGIVGSINISTANEAFTALRNTGDVTARSYAGGLCGYIYVKGGGSVGSTYWTTYTESSNAGNIIVSGDYAGGLYGYAYFTMSSGSAKTAMTALENTGNVTAGGANAGGIAGYAYTKTASEAKECSNTGVVTATDKSGDIFGEVSNITIVVSEGNTEE